MFKIPEDITDYEDRMFEILTSPDNPVNDIVAEGTRLFLDTVPPELILNAARLIIADLQLNSLSYMWFARRRKRWQEAYKNWVVAVANASVATGLDRHTIAESAVATYGMEDVTIAKVLESWILDAQAKVEEAPAS